MFSGDKDPIASEDGLWIQCDLIVVSTDLFKLGKGLKAAVESRPLKERYYVTSKDAYVLDPSSVQITPRKSVKRKRASAHLNIYSPLV